MDREECVHEYSPKNCCFVPKWMNHWFAKVGDISIKQEGKRWVFTSSVTTASRGWTKIRLSGNSREDVFDQYLLVKDMQFERRVWETMREYELLRKESTQTPEIHPTLISILDNYSTEEYLKLKNI